MLKVVKNSNQKMDKTSSYKNKLNFSIASEKSKVFYEFASPFLTKEKHTDELMNFFSFAIMAWNIGTIKSLEPSIFKEQVNLMKQDTSLDKKDVELFFKLVDNKEKLFSQHTDFIDDFEITEDKGGGLNLHVFYKDFEDIHKDGFSLMGNDLSDEDFEMDDLSNFEPGFINRTAISFSPKKPFFDWLNKIYPKNPIQEIEDKSMYLVHDLDDSDELKKWLKKNFDKIFVRELDNWHSNKKDWPKIRDIKLFEEWFTIESSTMVYDLESEPVRKEEF